MNPIRVFAVDDSELVLQCLEDACMVETDVTLVGTATNGEQALQEIPKFHPDIVLLDIEMPVMNGMETLRALRQDHPALPVIMFSAHTQQGARETINALMLGAQDYLTKPTGSAEASEAVRHIRMDLVPKIRALCPSTAGSSRRSAVAPQKEGAGDFKGPPRRSGRVEVVVIGVSTGGPAALASLLPRFPDTFPVPIVIVQHLPPLFTSQLATYLDARCELDVAEVTVDTHLEPGDVWLAPGDVHVELGHSDRGPVVRRNAGEPVNSCRPSVDVLFKSAARVFGKGTLGVVLTGMGTDGLCGSQVIKESGGQILVQDKDSSIVWGMPGAIAEQNLAQAVLPLPKMAAEILSRVQARDGLLGSESGER